MTTQTPIRPIVQPSPDEVITLVRAAQETGLSRNTLFRQVKSGRLIGETKDDPSLRASGGGPVIVVTRYALHTYLLSRSAKRAGTPKSVTALYITPQGMDPLDDVDTGV